MSTAATAPGRRVSLKTQNRVRRTTTGIIARAILIAVSLLFLVPLYWMVITAMKTDEELADFPPSLLPQSWNWSIFGEAVNAFPFWLQFGNSLLVTVLGTVLAVLSSYVVAYGFACIDWPGRDKVFYLVLATIFIPFPVAIIPLFDLFAWLGWVNTLLPLIVPNALGSAFYIFLLRQFLLQASVEAMDAARVDGASEWRICWQVVFPTARGALIAVAIFAAVASWNDFLGPLIYLQDPSVQTLAIGLQSFSTETDTSFNQLMAASTLTVLPMVVLFIFFQRYFVKGLNVGGFR
ncbi:ABC transporter permease subunit [Auraticoccus sp. F435]|uniref:ABC transporter permease subunit n=1 Tax=Auraticoccus cholistanensis TaxID=2656650 RepID=A0A6A9UYD2_9ACTN|nr:carbohydrate ABC transporter permease [Auraticoccus cholistanensis]MVA76517.1 ABC transporter permease subunit [Auraticoccus cholistanensis]